MWGSVFMAKWKTNQGLDLCKYIHVLCNVKHLYCWFVVNSWCVCLMFDDIFVMIKILSDFTTAVLFVYFISWENQHLWHRQERTHTHTRPCWTHINVCVWLLVVSSLTTPGKQLLTENSPTAVTTVVVQRNQTWLWVIVNWFSETAEKLSSLI